jgi:hypothetical protein
MEARASFNGASVSKTFVAAILVLVALGLGAMGGYVAKGLTAPGAAATQNSTVHAAPGSVLRQDSSARPAAELPSYIQNEFPQVPNRISTDDQYFIAQGATKSQTADDGTGGVLWNRGGHKQLP